MSVTQHPRARTEIPAHAPFAIQQRATRSGTVVAVSGELDAASAPALQAVLAEESVAREQVRLDLAGTTFIDSAGIRVLVRSMWDVREAGGTLRLTSASAMAENILRITGILDVLKEPAP